MTTLPDASRNLIPIGGHLMPKPPRISWWLLALLAVAIAGCAASSRPLKTDQPLVDVGNSSGKIETRLELIGTQAKAIVGKANETPKQIIIEQADAGKADVGEMNARIAELAASLTATQAEIEAARTELAVIRDSSSYRAGEWAKRQIEWIAGIVTFVLKWSVYILIAASVLRIVAAVVPGPWGRVLAIASHVGFAVGSGGISLPLTFGEWLWQWRSKKAGQVK